MTVAFRRGACPALSAPMQTGDGLLVRLALTGEALTPTQLIALCAAAARHGNGMVEITARGNFQIRGLTPSSAPSLADDIAAMNLNLRDGVPVETGPLAGLDPEEIADPRPLANAIRSAIDATDLAARLSPKVSVVIDGGGQFDMADIAADIRLTAMAGDDGVYWQVTVGRDAAAANHLGFAANVADAKAATLWLLERIASCGPTARARDLLETDVQMLRSTLPPSVLPNIYPKRRELSDKTKGGNVERDNLTDYSPLALADARFAVSVALPFGSVHADHLADFATQAAAIGTEEIRFAPARRLMLLCASQAAAMNIHATAREAGLIVDADDPRTHIFACPGYPACASGNIPARDIATVMATEWADLIGELNSVHISGCAKGCAHPAPSTLTFVGNGNRTALVLDGSARNDAAASVLSADLKPALARLARASRQSPTQQNDAQRLAAAFAGD